MQTQKLSLTKLRTKQFKQQNANGCPTKHFKISHFALTTSQHNMAQPHSANYGHLNTGNTKISHSANNMAFVNRTRHKSSKNQIKSSSSKDVSMSYFSGSPTMPAEYIALTATSAIMFAGTALPNILPN